MKYIIKLSSEIIIKSRSVRLFFIKSLTRNIQIILKQHGCLISSIIRFWDRIELCIANDDHNNIEVVQLLINIPGIYQVLLVKEFFFNNIQDIYKTIVYIYYNKLLGKSFCVRVKRHGNHNFKSKDIERYLGDYIRQNVENVHVKLINPEVIIFLEIIKDRCFIVFDSYKGLGGFPLGTQESVLSLISGGFDSAVSSYFLMRKGCKLHYCFFHFGETSYELGVKKIAYYLWNKFGSSHKVYFFSINCMPVINEIISKVNMKNIIVIFKRMMFRIASCIAVRYDMQSLATGESIGQVSSQTLTNLRIIDSVSDIIVLRPLIAYHKEEIISLSRNIGVEDMVKSIDFEYCSMFTKHVTARAIQYEIEQEETKIDFSIINKVLMKIQVSNICDILIVNKIQKNIYDIEITSCVKAGEIILDIRTPEEQKSCPLRLDKVIVKKLPFYKLVSQFINLDNKKFYLLYCKSGKMSKLQAGYLLELGFKNFKIYRPFCL